MKRQAKDWEKIFAEHMSEKKKITKNKMKQLISKITKNY